MIYEICAISTVIIFGILAYCIYTTLVPLKHTLRHLDILTQELNSKVKDLDSSFKSISNIGDVFEEKTMHFREEKRYLQESLEQKSDFNEGLAELLIAGLKMGATYLRRRRHEK